MIRLKKNTIKLLSGILMMSLGTALSGCSYSENISQDLLNIPKNEAQDISHGKIIVYGVAFEHLNTILKVMKFGIQPSNEGTNNVNFGLAYSIDYNDVRLASMGELNVILKQHGFNSLMEFTQKYSSAEPIMPKSAFRAVPKSLGQKLFNFTLENDYSLGRSNNSR